MNPLQDPVGAALTAAVTSPATAAGSEDLIFQDDFRGDDVHLLSSIESLLYLDAKNALRPHGLGGHGRSLLSACAARLKKHVVKSS